METYRKKLIEVALPLEAINKASAREKSIRHGHPSTLHLWWARRPLAACRAVIFAQLVDDPSSVPGEFPTEEAQRSERQRLFHIIEKLVEWENSGNEELLQKARLEIARSVARGKKVKFSPKMTREEVLTFLQEEAPPILDQFCGGGSIPLEAQRLGLRVLASDLNPVAVLITKALVEIPNKFANRLPISGEEGKQRKIHLSGWKGVRGLAEDVRFYGQRVREIAKGEVSHLYPKVVVRSNGHSVEADVIAWLWARTVPCPNPACGAQMPLVRSYWLCTKNTRLAWLRPSADARGNVSFQVLTGTPHSNERESIGAGASYVDQNGRKLNATFRCIVCGEGPVKGAYIDAEASGKGFGMVPLAVVADGPRGRAYLAFDTITLEHALEAPKAYLARPEVGEKIPTQPARGTFASNAQGRMYGFATFSDYFTLRQRCALAAFSRAVAGAHEIVRTDALKAGMVDDGLSLEQGGTGASAYADAVLVCLAFGLGRLANRSSSVCFWNTAREEIEQTFAHQGIQITWDFAEANVFSKRTGSWEGSLEWIPRVLEQLPARGGAAVEQLDARSSLPGEEKAVVFTDPPYYWNVSYSDLSDFFYVWLRPTLRRRFPNLFATVLTPKDPELIAAKERFGGDENRAKAFFEQGFHDAFRLAMLRQHDASPLALFYAFRQVEEQPVTDGEPVIASTGWETMLSGLLGAGFAIHGTWPLRTEREKGLKSGTNALASSVVLVCRPRRSSAALATRQEFIRDLRVELPEALRKLQHGSIAPVDLQQAAIGPGMAVFSRYAKVIEADGSAMPIRTALQLINSELEAFMRQEEGEADRDTQFCISWFEQYGMAAGPFGDADVLARAKNVGVEGMVRAGVVTSKGGRVALLPRPDYPSDWDPVADARLTLWECTQQLIKRLQEGGEAAAAALAAVLGPGRSEDAKTLAYRLYMICDRKGWSEEALAYNEFVVAWPEILKKAATITGEGPQKTFYMEEKK